MFLAREMRPGGEPADPGPGRRPQADLILVPVGAMLTIMFAIVGLATSESVGGLVYFTYAGPFASFTGIRTLDNILYEAFGPGA